MFFDLCVPINYKIKFLEAQVLKSYRIFIQKSYRGWAFSLPPPPPTLPLSKIGLMSLLI